MNLEPVFLLSFGRTGSTWLQRILNLHPRLTIWGEHYGFLEGIAEAYGTFRRFHESMGMAVGSRETTQDIIGPLRDPHAPVAWWVPWTPTELAQHFRDFIGRLFAHGLDERIRWGFKEIRYEELPLPSVLADLFPQARFLLLDRDETSCLQSMVLAWKDATPTQLLDAELRAFLGVQRARILRHRATFAGLRASIPDRVLDLTYEDLRDRFEATVAEIFAFLDEPLDAIPRETLDRAQRERTNATHADPTLRARIERLLREHDADDPS
jgi:hypothetical protein